MNFFIQPNILPLIFISTGLQVLSHVLTPRTKATEVSIQKSQIWCCLKVVYTATSHFMISFDATLQPQSDNLLRRIFIAWALSKNRLIYGKSIDVH